MQSVRKFRTPACLLAASLAVVACGGSKENTKPTPDPNTAGGNKGVAVTPEAYAATNIALVSFYGNKVIATKGLSDSGTKAAATNAWGEEAVGKGYQQAIESFNRATGVQLWAPDSFAAAEPYTAAKEFDDKDLVATSGLKKLPMADPAQLGKIATAAQLDAVIVVRNNWLINQSAEETTDKDGVTSRQQYGVAEVTVLMVNKDGKTVAEFKDTCQGMLDNVDRAYEQKGEIKPEDGKELLLEATGLCLHRFEESFRAKWPVTTPLRNIEDSVKANEAADAKAKAEAEAAEAAAAAAKLAEEEAARLAEEEAAASKGKKKKKK